MGDAKDQKPAASPSAPGNPPSAVPRMWREDEPEPSSTFPTGIPRLSPACSVKRPHLLVITGATAGRVLLIESAKLTIGRSRQADFTLPDDGVSRMHCGIACDGTTCVISDLGSTHGTVINGTRVESVQLSPGDRVQLGPNVLLEYDLCEGLEEGVADKLYHGATRDLLTRALNRRAFQERLCAEVAYAARHRAKLIAASIDIDCLDALVDRHGHAAGDAVLRDVATAIASTLRSEDVLARPRREGFVVLGRGLALRNGVKLAERIRKLLEEHVVTFDGLSLRVTVSAGVAELGEVEAPATANALLLLADDRLAAAKAAGTNRVGSKSSRPPSA